MSTHAHAVVIHGAGDLRIEDRTVANPESGQAHVHVALGGICGSDISYYRKGAVGQYTVTAPMVLGHEVIGSVGSIGKGVTGVAEDVRVAVDPSSPCWQCERCRQARFNVCLNPSFLGSASTQPHTDGGFTSVLVSNATNLVPLDPSLSDELAVFAEPLAVSVHAVERVGGVKGARVLVVGAGPIGGMIIALAAHGGAAEVVAADVDRERLRVAKALGAGEVRHVGHEDIGKDYDIVFDASGAAPAIADALGRIRRGGAFVMVGLPHADPIGVPLALTVTGELDVYGSFRFNHDEFRTSVDLLTGGLDLRPLISNRYSSHDCQSAFVDASSGQSLKVHLDFNAQSAESANS